MRKRFLGILGVAILIIGWFYFTNSSKVIENSGLSHITLWVHKEVPKPNIAQTQDESLLKAVNKILDNLEWADDLGFDIHEKDEDYEFWIGLKTGNLNADYYVWFNTDKNIIFNTMTGKYAVISNEAAYSLKASLDKITKKR